jgi:hypothetical protein
MLHTYHNALKEHYFKAEKLKKHALLKSAKWTKAGYELLSDLIGEELNKSLSLDEQRRMGTSISPRTLQSFFDGSYKLSYPLDPRTLNTLNKMVRFIGIDSWDTFVNTIDNQEIKAEATASDDALVLAVVKKFVEAEFKVYAALPKADFSFLDKICIEKSGAWLRVHDAVLSNQSQNRCMSNAYNPSTVEVLDTEIVRLEANYAQVKTKEYWLLCWWSLEQDRYVQRFKDINEHFYILTKMTEGWRVKTNASLAELNGEWRPESEPSESVKPVKTQKLAPKSAKVKAQVSN